MTFEVRKPPTPTATSTPKKASTPYQTWREQRVDSTAVTSISASGGAVSKTTPQQPKSENAEDILKRWKTERAKRIRHTSGNSSEASSTTAEPTVKKSSFSAVFHPFSRKKSKESQENKYSITALMTSAALNPEFHDTVLRPASNGNKQPQEANGEKAPILGTVLKPVLPKSTGGATPTSSTTPRTGATPRTPFEEWRHYRALRDGRPSPSPTFRTRTPDPDYDTVSIASSTGSKSSGAGLRLSVPSSHEDLHRQVGPQYYGNRSSSAMGIPRYIHRPPRPPSLMSASPRLEHPPSEAHLASLESQLWYQNYSHESFPHEAEFDERKVVGNYDGRIHSIRGKAAHCIHMWATRLIAPISGVATRIKSGRRSQLFFHSDTVGETAKQKNVK